MSIKVKFKRVFFPFVVIIGMIKELKLISSATVNCLSRIFPNLIFVVFLGCKMQIENNSDRST